MFITFEGIEGAGKSTQANLLANYLNDKKIPFVITREPGGTQLGEYLRALVLSGSPSPNSELFLFMADRAEHLERVIKPALDSGKWVICDRYIDSTYAYQYGGRQRSRQTVLDAMQLTNPVIPDMTFYLDVSVDDGLKRARDRGDLDSFESEAMEFHIRVKRAYKERQDENKNRIKTINCHNHQPEYISKEIINKVISFCRCVKSDSVCRKISRGAS